MKTANRRWLLFALAAAFCWGLWGVIAKLISDDVSPYMNHLLFTMGMMCTLPFVIKKCKASTFTKMGLLWGLISGLFAVVGNIAVYKAFTSGGQASVVIPVTNLYPLVTIILALVLLKEKLNVINVLGIFLALPAILLLSGEAMLFTNPKDFFTSLGLNTWLLLSFVALVCWGIFSACQKVTTNYITAEWSYAIFIFASFIISIVFLVFGQWQSSLSNNAIILGTVAGMLNGLGVLAIFAAYRTEGKASAVTTVAGALQPLFTILLAVLFLKEDFTKVEGVGMALAVSGALLLSYEKKNP